jgi:hypothetical protein
MVPLLLPEVGESANQLALSLAVQLKVPPPVLVRLKVWLAGLLPPCWAEKDRLIGLIPMAGLAGGGVGAGGGVEAGRGGGVSNCDKPGISEMSRFMGDGMLLLAPEDDVDAVAGAALPIRPIVLEVGIGVANVIV